MVVPLDPPPPFNDIDTEWVPVDCGVNGIPSCSGSDCM